jgi:Fic family protein
LILNTLRYFNGEHVQIPLSTSWILAELSEFRGKQDLYTRQSPERLKKLREHAVIESAVSSNRLEGISVSSKQIQDLLVHKKTFFRDRDEEEVQGYRDALAWIHADATHIPINEQTIKRLHAMSRGQIWDAGLYKEKDGDIIERYPDGRERLRFRTVSATETPKKIAETISYWEKSLDEQRCPGLLLLAAFNLDFLCVHPFRDGNGRVSRLLWLLQSYQLGHEVGRYVSIERIVEQNKERYYETLEHSSNGWHQCTHDPWPFINYFLHIMKIAYKEFSERLGNPVETGTKTERILGAIRKFPGQFTISELALNCPGISREMIRHVLKKQRTEGEVECHGRGTAAKWTKTQTKSTLNR